MSDLYSILHFILDMFLVYFTNEFAPPDVAGNSVFLSCASKDLGALCPAMADFTTYCHLPLSELIFNEKGVNIFIGACWWRWSHLDRSVFIVTLPSNEVQTEEYEGRGTHTGRLFAPASFCFNLQYLVWEGCMAYQGLLRMSWFHVFINLMLSGWNGEPSMPVE